MIFSDNYDKLIEAQKTYNAEIQKNPTLSELDDVTDFFGVTFANFESQFKQIYNYLTTVNTKNNKVVSYSAVPNNSLQAHTVIMDLVKNAGVSSQFLTTEAESRVLIIPNLVVNYNLNNSSASLSLANNSLVSCVKATSGNETSTTNKVAFNLTFEGKQYVVVRELTKVNSASGSRAELNDFMIDAKTKVISYIRNFCELTKSDGYSSCVQNVYVADGKNCAFISKLNNDKPATLSVDDTPIIFDPSKTKINDYNDYFAPNFKPGAMFAPVKEKSKKYGKAITVASGEMGYNKMFFSLASKLSK